MPILLSPVTMVVVVQKPVSHWGCGGGYAFENGGGRLLVHLTTTLGLSYPKHWGRGSLSLARRYLDLMI